MLFLLFTRPWLDWATTDTTTRVPGKLVCQVSPVKPPFFLGRLQWSFPFGLVSLRSPRTSHLGGIAGEGKCQQRIIRCKTGTRTFKVPRLWFPSGRRRYGMSHDVLDTQHSRLFDGPWKNPDQVLWYLPRTTLKPVGLGVVIAVHPLFGPSRVSCICSECHLVAAGSTEVSFTRRCSTSFDRRSLRTSS